MRGPLAMGILTGKFTAGVTFEAGDFRARWLENPDEHQVFQDDLEKVERLKPLARGKSLAQLALQFTLAHPAVTTVIPGAKTPGQLADNLGAAEMAPLGGEEMAVIDELTPPSGGRKIWPA